MPHFAIERKFEVGFDIFLTFYNKLKRLKGKRKVL
jgi:hypothetical protein